MKKIVALVLCLVLALSLCTVAFGATTLTGTYYYQDTTETLSKTEDSTTTINYTAAKAPTTTNGATTNGNVAYYELTAKSGKYYVEVATLAEADVVVGTGPDMTKNHYLYLKEIAAVAYVNATVFTDFGTKCGQVNATPADGVTYYLFEVGGAKYVTSGAATVAAADAIVMVNGKVVNTVGATAYDVVDHVAAASVDKTTGKVTGYTCSACGLAAIDAGTVAAIPTTGVQVLTTSYYWATATAAGTASTTVESAKTFDAGIALYAGMALASVAGSAVVIGKKKEF